MVSRGLKGYLCKKIFGFFVDVLVKQQLKLPQIFDVFLVMFHSGKLRDVLVVHFQCL